MSKQMISVAHNNNCIDICVPFTHVWLGERNRTAKFEKNKPKILNEPAELNKNNARIEQRH